MTSSLHTPRYDNATHAKHSYCVLLVALILTFVDVLSALKRLFVYCNSVRAKQQPFSLRALWRTVVLAREDRVALGHFSEYANLVVEPDEFDEHERAHAPGSPDSADEGQWVNAGRGAHASRDCPDSPASERTVFGTRSPKGSQHSADDLPAHLAARAPRTRGLLRRAGAAAFATTERALVLAAFGELLEGIVVYTGGCRGNYFNGCLAHLVSECSHAPRIGPSEHAC